MPKNAETSMEETEKVSRFTYCDIFAYVKDGKYPTDFTKDEKHALRKRAKFFAAKGTALYYVKEKKVKQYVCPTSIVRR